MRAQMAKLLSLAGSLAVLFWLTSPALPQGFGSSRAAPPRATRPPTPEEFQRSFWKYLNRQESPYNQWSSIPGKEGLQTGEPPHGKFTKTYANKVAAGDLKKLRLNSILVTENYAADQKTLQDITVMYKVKGTDPQHNDWYWLKYQPDGAIARTPDNEGKKPIAGQVASCIECHSKAAGTDFVFSNDPAETPQK